MLKLNAFGKMNKTHYNLTTPHIHSTKTQHITAAVKIQLNITILFRRSRQLGKSVSEMQS